MEISDCGLWIVGCGRRFLPWATAVLLLAALFRLVALTSVPPGLAQDEVLDADIASFIRAGYHAFFFRDGYGHEPLYHYFAVPFAPLVGDNVLAIRLPSVILGLLLVALTMRWAKREFDERTAVVAGLGLAISWWPIIFSRIGIRPILLPVLLLLALWFWQRPLLAGLFLGLSFYSYTAARIIFLLPLGYALAQRLAGRRTIGGMAWWRWLVVTLGVFMLVAALMQITLWRDPTLQQRIDQLSGPLEALRAGDPGPILYSSLRTLGVFSFVGDPRWTYTVPERPLFDPLTAIFFYAGLSLVLWRWRDGRMALLLLWLAVGLIPSAITPQAPSTVRLVMALPAVYTLLAVGIAEFWQRLARGDDRLADNAWLTKLCSSALIRTSGFLLLLLLALINGWRTGVDGFVTWPQAQQTRLNHYQAALWQMARHVAANPPARLTLVDSFYEPIDRDSFRRSLGRDPAARWVQTGAGVAGALVLPAGAGNGRLYVPEYAPVPADLLAAAGIAAQPLYRSSSFPSFAVYELPLVGETAVAPPITTFNHSLSLMKYETLPVALGEPLRLLTWWRVERHLPEDLATFVHLFDETGTLTTQHDGWDAAPAALQPGDVVLQRHLIWLPPDLPAEACAIQLGVYQRRDGRRWLRDNSTMDSLRLLALFDAGFPDE